MPPRIFGFAGKWPPPCDLLGCRRPRAWAGALRSTNRDAFVCDDHSLLLKKLTRRAIISQEERPLP